MKTIAELTKEHCAELISKLVKTLYNVELTPVVEIHVESNRRADASSAVAFQLAGKLKKNPNEIAEKIASEIKKPNGAIETISTLNGFVNFTFSQEYYANSVANALKQDFGCKEKNSETIVIDYSAPNIGKPLHIGHIRSTIFGNSLKKLLECQGYTVIGFNYLGDSGAQVAKLLLALETYKHLPAIKTEKDLLAYYVKINEEIEKNPELKEKERKILEAIENGEKGIQRNLEKIRKLSLKAFEKSYELLGVEFEEVKGESYFVESAKKIALECIEKNIAIREKEGELVAKLEPALPNILLMRSNGTTLYSTRDISLADYKFQKYKFVENIYTTASEQNLHFKQVFAILDKLGRKYNNKHVGFGLITLEGERLSTREGRVLFLTDVIQEAQREAKVEIVSRDGNLKSKELNERSLAIGLAALKFAVLKVSPEKDINFNFKAMTSFEGDTGSYLQYSLVRCKSILRKVKEKKKEKKKQEEKTQQNKGYQFNSEEKELLLRLSVFPIVTSNASRSLSPHTLCDYLLKTAACFSTFYAIHSVLDAESETTREARIKIVEATANVMEKGLTLLGITPIEKM